MEQVGAAMKGGMSLVRERVGTLIVYFELKDRVVGHCSCTQQKRGVNRVSARQGVDGEEWPRPLELRRRTVMVLVPNINND